MLLKKELLLLFRGQRAYFLLAAAVLLISLYLMPRMNSMQSFGTAAAASDMILISYLSGLALAAAVFLPSVLVLSIHEERNAGTLDSLMGLPRSPMLMLLAKGMAAMAGFFIVVVASLPLLAVVFFSLGIDFETILGGLVMLTLWAFILEASSVLAAVRTKRLLAAFILLCAILAGLQFLAVGGAMLAFVLAEALPLNTEAALLLTLGALVLGAWLLMHRIAAAGWCIAATATPELPGANDYIPVSGRRWPPLQKRFSDAGAWWDALTYPWLHVLPRKAFPRVMGVLYLCALVGYLPLGFSEPEITPVLIYAQLVLLFLTGAGAAAALAAAWTSRLESLRPAPLKPRELFVQMFRDMLGRLGVFHGILLGGAIVGSAVYYFTANNMPAPPAAVVAAPLLLLPLHVMAALFGALLLPGSRFRLAIAVASVWLADGFVALFLPSVLHAAAETYGAVDTPYPWGTGWEGLLAAMVVCSLPLPVLYLLCLIRLRALCGKPRKR